MPIDRLRIQHFRNVIEADWQPAAGFNILTGANGSGKTSLLEAIYFLSSGKSFRPGSTPQLINYGADSLAVYAEVRVESNTYRFGVSKNRKGELQVRLQGQATRGIAPVSLLLPVVAIHSESYHFVDSGPETKRRFLDWLVFHVKPKHLLDWKNYRQLLIQTNALLKDSANSLADRRFWYQQLAAAGENLEINRQEVFQQWRQVLQSTLSDEIFTSLDFDAVYHRGWKAETGLLEDLLAHDSANCRYGVVTVGPHRMDMRFRSVGQSAKQVLSRGQKKLMALEMFLAQIRLINKRTGHWPIVCLDDVDAELDDAHLHHVMNRFDGMPTQVFISSLRPELLLNHGDGVREKCVFHVKHDILQSADGTM